MCALYAPIMVDASKSRPLRKSLKQRIQRYIQVKYWGMDIHESAWIADTALIDRTWPKGIHIGASCIIDDQAVILCHDVTRALHVDTWIGANTCIGARAIILPGIRVGAGCVVEAGALVNRDVADGQRVMGNPARVVADDAGAAA